MSQTVVPKLYRSPATERNGQLTIKFIIFLKQNWNKTN